MRQQRLSDVEFLQLLLCRLTSSPSLTRFRGERNQSLQWEEGIKPNLRIPEPSVIGPIFISKKKEAKFKRWLAGDRDNGNTRGRRYR